MLNICQDTISFLLDAQYKKFLIILWSSFYYFENMSSAKGKLKRWVTLYVRLLIQFFI